MRWLVWLTMGFAFGCALGGYLFRGTGLLVMAGLSLCLAIPAAISGRKDRCFAALAVILAGLGAGCGYFYGYDLNYVNCAREMDGASREIQMTVSDYSWETDYGGAVDGTVEIEGKQYKLRLYLDGYQVLSPGDTVRVTVQLRFTDEGGSREPTFHRTNGILLLGYQREDAVITEGTPDLSHIPAVIRSEIKRRIDRCFPEDTAGFARALLLGDRTELSYDTNLSFRLTGVSHVVAVSGLHVSILFALVLLVTGKQRHLTALFGIPLVLLFAAVAGFTPSVTRAAVMQILMMLALLFRREYDPPTALAFAVLVILAWNPLSATSTGFQMSVASVAGIYLFYSRLRNRILARFGERSRGKGFLPKLIRGVVSSVSLSLSTSVLTMPLSAYYYGTVSLMSVPANLLIVPVIGAVFYGVMVSCGISTVLPGLGRLIGYGVSVAIRGILAAAGCLSELPLAAVFPNHVYIRVWLILCLLLIGTILLRKPEKVWPAAAVGAGGLALALILSFAAARTDDYRVTVLDVGQGQCVILQSRDRVMLVDCGGDYDEDAADKAAETLLGMGFDRIDGLILSHYDRDHAGGVPYLLRRIDVERVYLPQDRDTKGVYSSVMASLGDTERIWLEKDRKIALGSATVQLYVPDSEKSGNESCVSVLFQNEKYDTLIISDMSAVGERALLDRAALPDLEVLVVGHHGSADSTSAELLYRTAPDLAIISVGADNAYGHPAEAILNRLRLYGCDVYRTDLMGDIVFRG